MPPAAHHEDPRYLILPPHIGRGTLEAMERMEVFLAEQLKQWSSAHQLIEAKD